MINKRYVLIAICLILCFISGCQEIPSTFLSHWISDSQILCSFV